MATCREFIREINDPRSLINCGSCVKYDRIEGRCSDEDGVVQRYEDSPEYAVIDKEIRSNKGVYIE